MPVHPILDTWSAAEALAVSSFINRLIGILWARHDRLIRRGCPRNDGLADWTHAMIYMLEDLSVELWTRHDQAIVSERLLTRSPRNLRQLHLPLPEFRHTDIPF
jgi:hypothetical protein